VQRLEPPYDPLIVWLPKTWLLREGWRRHGLVRMDEVQGPLANAAANEKPVQRAAT